MRQTTEIGDFLELRGIYIDIEIEIRTYFQVSYPNALISIKFMLYYINNMIIEPGSINII